MFRSIVAVVAELGERRGGAHEGAARRAVLGEQLLQSDGLATERARSAASSRRAACASARPRVRRGGQLRPVARREERLEARRRRRRSRARASAEAAVDAARGTPPRAPSAIAMHGALVLLRVEHVGDVRRQPREVLDRAERRRRRAPAAARRWRRRARAAARRRPARRRGARAWLGSRFWRGAAWAVLRRAGRRPRRPRAGSRRGAARATKSSATAASK